MLEERALGIARVAVMAVGRPDHAVALAAAHGVAEVVDPKTVRHTSGEIAVVLAGTPAGVDLV